MRPFPPTPEEDPGARATRLVHLGLPRARHRSMMAAGVHSLTRRPRKRVGVTGVPQE